MRICGKICIFLKDLRKQVPKQKAYQNFFWQAGNS